ncbi:biotin/lipoate A/B protein ligase family protein [Zafaria sp. Z1313]|uniref:lipoate--protein ligase family protein n=1 Tax=unclassified Zafaria TaxID=2828765 RepID=UPI002E7AABA7|nr:biotin/lipoate A/B protein ligase family protein [Zafaria sp. J156]MEE1620229.1 biotin/lipoate A/B protein ligase family protein [Zafaria sp. J156]
MPQDHHSTVPSPSPHDAGARPGHDAGPGAGPADGAAAADVLHRGAYKVPGGKLVAVELRTGPTDGAGPAIITEASVNGDFFLEPDEALEDLNAALCGLPADAPHAELRDAVARGLRPGAVMTGFDAAAVATAARRALGHATTWEDHAWEVIAPEPLPIAVNVALDEVLTREVAAGTRNPTLRLWDWTEKAVVIGSFQSLRNEVDAEAAERHGVTVVRRISGGGAMFMEAGNCITYSLYLPASLVDGMSFADSYAFLDAWVMEALAGLGVRAFYKPLNDIATDDGKIGGAAQKRLAGGGLLHHVTMSYDIDADKMTEVLRIGREKLSDKGIASAKKRVDPLKRHTGRSRGEIIEAMMQTFTRRYGASRGGLDAATLHRARELAEEKFLDPGWTSRVP